MSKTLPDAPAAPGGLTTRSSAGAGESHERPTKRSLTLRGHRTSVSLEPCFWEALRRLAAQKGRSVNDLAAEIDAARAAQDPGVSLASALRTHLMKAALAGGLSTSPSGSETEQG